jgi:putative aldouronate transport system permease protein
MSRVLGLRNNYLALVLPLVFSVFNLLVMKSFMSSGVPDALPEAARIDGCGDFGIYCRIYLPLSKPAVATIGLFLVLAYWNDWYNAMLYINKEAMYPLQYFLYQKVNNIEAYKKLIAQMQGSSAMAASLIELPTQTLKMALTVVVTGPIILAYPFAQKYFVQGITVGAVKG